MIRKCKEKASAAGYEIELKSCDFRKLSCWEGKQFDCVASTGNSLPHVNNDDVLTALEQMNSLVKKGGYLYLDTRNWEKILNEKEDSICIIPFLQRNAESIWFKSGIIVLKTL